MFSPCDPADDYEFDETELKVTAFCRLFGSEENGEYRTMYAPYFAKKWLQRRGARRGKCRNRENMGKNIRMVFVG